MQLCSTLTLNYSHVFNTGITYGSEEMVLSVTTFIALPATGFLEILPLHMMK